MSHWFDSLVKNAASGPTRRQAFAVGLGGAAGVMVRGRVLAQAGNPATCRSSTAQAATGVDITGVYQDLTLRHTASVDRAAATRSLHTTLSRNASPIMDLDIQIAANGAVTGSVIYGQGVQGVSNVRMSSPDGQAFAGIVDGRQFSSGRVKSFDQLRFADGAPAPRILVDQMLRQQVDALIAQMRADGGRCVGSPAMPAAIPRRSFYDGGPNGGRSYGGPAYSGESRRDSDAQRGFSARTYQRIPDQGAPYRGPGSPPDNGSAPPPQVPNEPGSGANWYPAGAYEADLGGACTGCQKSCIDQYDTCFLQSLTDIFWCPPCAVTEPFACLGEMGICLEGCYIAGAGCCPVGCGAHLGTGSGVPTFINCCAPGETCISQSGGGACCPARFLPCGSDCCDADIKTCAPNGGCGCQDGLTACGDQCCPPNEMCCGGTTCCSAGQCQNGLCCASFCGDQCCPPFATCCNGQCCPGNGTSQCLGGRCCPQAQVCGPTCCAAGENCLDARVGRCGTEITCRSDLTPCRSTVNGAWTTICCRRGMVRMGSSFSEATCCNGQCCAPGQMCCYNRRAGTTGCWNSDQCDRPN